MVQREMVSVYPIRYRDHKIEFLLIKRATPGFNWQCVTGSVGQTMGRLDHPKVETPLECAKRELHEETGYKAAEFIKFILPEECSIEREEDEGNKDPILLASVSDVKFHEYIARIDETQDPVLNPEEHTKWKWCDAEEGYRIIKYAVEKKTFKYVSEFIKKNPLV